MLCSKVRIVGESDEMKSVLVSDAGEWKCKVKILRSNKLIY